MTLHPCLPGPPVRTTPWVARMGNDLLRFAVVALSSINCVMWEFYTESRLMAIVWAGVAVGFLVWAVREIRNR